MPFYNSKKIFEANLLLYSLSLWNILSIVWDLTSLRLELRTPPPSRKFIHRAMSLPDASKPPAGVIEGFHDLRWLVVRNKHYSSSSFHLLTFPSIPRHHLLGGLPHPRVDKAYLCYAIVGKKSSLQVQDHC